MDRQKVTISQNAKTYHRLVWAHPNFVEKTFVGGSKTVKFVNVFSLESFALYDITHLGAKLLPALCVLTS